jgi:hypothetical protein
MAFSSYIEFLVLAMYNKVNVKMGGIATGGRSISILEL